MLYWQHNLDEKSYIPNSTDLGSRRWPTTFYVATQNGHLPFVEQLLKEKGNPNIPVNDGATPLHIASANGYLQIVLKKKADIKSKTKDKAIPLRMLFASQNGHLPVIKRLLKEK